MCRQCIHKEGALANMEPKITWSLTMQIVCCYWISEESFSIGYAQWCSLISSIRRYYQIMTKKCGKLYQQDLFSPSIDPTANQNVLTIANILLNKGT
ncbi:unnamed protein product [Urochloa humidicola]